MSPLPLPLAASASDAVFQITDAFGINLPAILAQMLSFAVVAYILWRFGFKSVLATLDERQKKIESGLAYAEEMKAKLAAAQQAADAQFKEAQARTREILAEAQKAAKDFGDRRQQEAMERAAALLQQAQETIELEKKKMLAEARAEIARLVVATAGRVLATELSEADRARYNTAAARELSRA